MTGFSDSTGPGPVEEQTGKESTLTWAWLQNRVEDLCKGDLESLIGAGLEDLENNLQRFVTKNSRKHSIRTQMSREGR